MKKDCLTCKYFKSFANDYIDDCEPDEYGFCFNEKSKYYMNNGAGVGVVCKHYKSRLPVFNVIYGQITGVILTDDPMCGKPFVNIKTAE